MLNGTDVLRSLVTFAQNNPEVASGQQQFVVQDITKRESEQLGLRKVLFTLDGLGYIRGEYHSQFLAYSFLPGTLEYLVERTKLSFLEIAVQKKAGGDILLADKMYEAGIKLGFTDEQITTFCDATPDGANLWVQYKHFADDETRQDISFQTFMVEILARTSHPFVKK